MGKSPTPPSSAVSVKRRVWRVVRSLVLVYLAVCLLMMGLETTLIYPVPPKRVSPSAEELGFEDVWFESADGTRLHGWYFAHAEPRFGLVYCHGNGEDVTDNADLVRLFHDRYRASVFLFDYRGYGQSAGSPHEAGIVADGLAAQLWLAKRLQVETDEMVLVGRSLGGAVAVAMAEQQGARALVLQNTFSSMVDVAADKYPWLPVRWIMRNRYPSAERIAAYDGPLLQNHGTVDRVAPMEFGKRLFEAAPSEAKQFIELPDYGHNDQFPETYFGALGDFLDGV